MNVEIKEFLAGFDLAGKRLANGKLESYINKALLNDWPDEIDLFGNTYILEEVTQGYEGYESAQYV